MLLGASLVAQMVNNQHAMQETQVWSLGQEDPLEKEMATHSSTLAWKTPWTEEPGRLQSMGLQRVRHDWATSLHFIALGVKAVASGEKNSAQQQTQQRQQDLQPINSEGSAMENCQEETLRGGRFLLNWLNRILAEGRRGFTHQRWGMMNLIRLSRVMRSSR